ncbi:MAG: peptidoglycan-associated lipoprotein Pal [Thioalkalispiraceae bacterium]
MKWTKTLVSLVLLTSLAACTAPGKKPADEQAQADAGSVAGDERTAGVDLQGGYDIKSLDDPASPLSRRVIYFELDSASLSEEDRQLIAEHARFMAANPDISAVLEGHADERGTREYNIALGERRAKAVKQLMTLQGVGQNQAQVISFGEERPVSLGHNEESWRLNRRVEILYSGY